LELQTNLAKYRAPPCITIQDGELDMISSNIGFVYMLEATKNVGSLTAKSTGNQCFFSQGVLVHCPITQRNGIETTKNVDLTRRKVQ